MSEKLRVTLFVLAFALLACAGCESARTTSDLTVEVRHRHGQVEPAAVLTVSFAR